MNKLFLIFAFFILSGFSEVNFVKENSEFLKAMSDLKVGVVAPASGKNTEIMQELQRLPQLKLVFPKHCFSSPVRFHSASDEIRLKCLKDALLNNSTNVIWSLRGGYGSQKLIPELMKLPEPQSEKYFIGYSDITSLHLFFAQNWGWKTIHGSGIAEILESDKARENFIKIADIITGKVDKVVINGLIPLNQKAFNTNSVNGMMSGGNLTIVQTSIGTPWQIVTHEKILFLEDVEIKPYQLDRTLYHLKHAGLLNGIKAIIFGEFTSASDVHLKVLKEFADKINVPVFKSNRFGHTRFNDPVVYNSDATINSSNGKTYNLTMKLK